MPCINKRYIVKLNRAEREELEGLVSRGRVAAQRRRHGAILLAVDEGKYGPAMSDAEAAEHLDLTARTIERTRARCVCDGLEKALARKPRSRERTPRLDGEGEARLVSLACSEAPPGQARWTLQMLADKLVELEIVETVCHETVRRVLKKHHQAVAP